MYNVQFVKLHLDTTNMQLLLHRPKCKIKPVIGQFYFIKFDRLWSVILSLHKAGTLGHTCNHRGVGAERTQYSTIAHTSYTQTSTRGVRDGVFVRFKLTGWIRNCCIAQTGMYGDHARPGHELFCYSILHKALVTGVGSSATTRVTLLIHFMGLC